MDFAIIKIGGKQYKVRQDDIIRVEKLSQDKKKLEFQDLLANKKVIAEIIGQGKNKKVRILKFRRRKRYKRLKGHRQPYSEIKIISIK